MRVINKKIVITILVILEICSIYLMYKSYNNKNLVEDKIEEQKKEKLAIKVDNGNGEYVYSSIFPGKGYELNKELTECIDIEGNKVNNPKITSDGDSVTITSKYTNYCTLYFYLPESREYEYTGNYQVFIAPKDGEYRIELWGASGHDTSNEYFLKKTSGRGAYTKGTIKLKKNEKLYFYIGQLGTYGSYNGGGYGEAPGGGATDVRLNITKTGNWDDFDSLKSRIMVAAGGGGGAYYQNIDYTQPYQRGDGGTLKGIDAQFYVTHGTTGYGYSGHGGTQTSGGEPGETFSAMDPQTIPDMCGKFGKGGYSNRSSGGGGGYYGGGHGNHTGDTWSGGGGGSSYISGYTGCVAIKESSTENNVQPKDGCTDGTQNINCSYHYSNKIFIDTEMIAGNSQMPTYDGKGTMIGNTGNGHAKISFVG